MQLIARPSAVISRAEAKARGLTRYFTGKVCRQGHTAERRTSNGQCAICARAVNKSFYAAHPDLKQAKRRREYAKNRERYAKYHKAYRQGHPGWVPRSSIPKQTREERNAKVREWRAANYERVIALNRLREARPDVRAKRRAYAQRTMAHISQQAKAWNLAHPERRREIANAWVRRNPEQGAAHTALRRARTHAATRNEAATTTWIVAARQRQSVRCYWCAAKTRRGKARHIDHIIPLVKGGLHTPGNLCISCARCNQRKGSKLPEDFVGQAEMAFA